MMKSVRVRFVCSRMLSALAVAAIATRSYDAVAEDSDPRPDLPYAKPEVGLEPERLS